MAQNNTLPTSGFQILDHFPMIGLSTLPIQSTAGSWGNTAGIQGTVDEGEGCGKHHKRGGRVHKLHAAQWHKPPHAWQVTNKYGLNMD